jgi:hypothetical protein
MKGFEKSVFDGVQDSHELPLPRRRRNVIGYVLIEHDQSRGVALLG